MTALPLPLTDARARDRAVAGGKGASLAAMTAAGFAVPPGFIIPPALVLALDAGSAPSSARAAVLEHFRALAAGGAVAVRSSALDEDADEASFAGQHVTVLDVATEEAFWAAIHTCLASLHSEAAASYRAHAGKRAPGPAMALVVQRMVPARAAGVAFSVDPLTGGTARLLVEAVLGKGEALVSGQAEAERHVLSRESLAILESHAPGPAVLSPEDARTVAGAALAAERVFGQPQDIEFAFEGGHLWLLQSRPITAAGAPAPGGGWYSEFDSPTSPADYWTSANIQEVLPGLLTPLTMTTFEAYAVQAYADGYRRMHLLAEDEEPRFVGMFYNRAYLNIDATRIIADRSIGSSGDAVEHRFLGGEYRSKGRKPQSLRLWKFRFRSFVPLMRMLFGIHRAGDRIQRETAAMERRVLAERPAEMGGPQLDARRRELGSFVAGTFQVHLQASGCAAAGFDIVSRLVQPILREETESRVPLLFTGLRGVESAQISLDLWDLSRTAIAAGVASRLERPGFEPLSPDTPAAWRSGFARFLQRHGHRGLNEMEPAVPDWRQDPAPVLAVVAGYTQLPEDQSPPALLDRQEQERLRLTRRLETRMNPAKRWLFRRLLREAQRWVALRERTKSIIVRGTRLVDHYVPELERRLLAAGAISAPGDLFYLTSPELDAFLGGEQADYRPAVARRRREFERNRYVQLPERFHGHPVPLEPGTTGHEGDVLTGTPVSPGVATGRARVILDPRTDGPISPGEILVAPVTDAGWTPLFALAAGLVVDMGSALSHGSTVAREYGLPAVVNVRRGTAAIRTGDLVVVNGTKGTVTILESPPA